MSEIVLSESQQHRSAAGYLNSEGNLSYTDEAENDATVCVFVCVCESTPLGYSNVSRV